MPSQTPEGKNVQVRYVLEITGAMIKDGTYYGTTETVGWFFDRAQRDTDSMKVLIQSGVSEPVQLMAAKVKVKTVILDDAD